MSVSIGEFEGDKTYEDGKQYADDDKLLVRFESRAVKNEFRSKAEGRPIFEDADYIQIIIPGSRDISSFPMDDTYKRRFNKRYSAWLENKENTKVDGTILAELTWMTKSQIAELNYCNVFTVEQLANLSDTNARQFMGNYQLRDRAKNFLAQAAGEAPMLKMQAELEQRDNHIQALEQKINDLTEAFAKMEKKNR